MTDAAPAAPPQLSPDGRWWWDGTQWVPAPTAPPPPPPAAADPAPLHVQVPLQPGGPAPSPGPSQPGAAAGAYVAQRTFVPAYVPATAPPGKVPGIISFVLSLVWMLGLGSLAAVVLGHVSRSKDKRAGAAPSGFATAGLVLGYLGLVLSLPVMAAVALPTFLAQKEAAQSADLRSELRNASVAQEQWMTDTGAYATSVGELTAAGYAGSSSVTLDVVSAGSTAYCLRAQAPDSEPLYLDSSSYTVSSTPCG